MKCINCGKEMKSIDDVNNIALRIDCYECDNCKTIAEIVFESYNDDKCEERWKIKNPNKNRLNNYSQIKKPMTRAEFDELHKTTFKDILLHISLIILFLLLIVEWFI